MITARHVLRKLMTTINLPDYVGLKVFTQLAAETNQEGGDVEAAKIFGDLHSLACNAEARAKLRLDMLDNYVSAEEIDKTKEELDGGATGEILLIATVLRVMAETTEEHANDLRADEATLRAEDADCRAGRYRAAYDALLHIFND